MANAPDYSQMMKDMMGSFDTSSVEAMTRSQAQLAERMAQVAISAARQSTDLSAKWMQDALSKVSAVAQAKQDPADYAKGVAQFMSTSAESAAEHMAAFAEIARRVQTETMELVLNAGKQMGTDMTDAARRATDGMASAAQVTSTSTNV